MVWIRLYHLSVCLLAPSRVCRCRWDDTAGSSAAVSGCSILVLAYAPSPTRFSLFSSLRSFRNGAQHIRSDSSDSVVSRRPGQRGSVAVDRRQPAGSDTAQHHWIIHPAITQRDTTKAVEYRSKCWNNAACLLLTPVVIPSVLYH